MSNNSDGYPGYKKTSLSKFSSPQLEINLLGLVYINNKTAAEIIPYLTKEDFSVYENAMFYELLHEMFFSNISINYDQVMLFSKNKAAYNFISVEYLEMLQAGAGLSSNIIQYLQEIERLTKLRTIEQNLNFIQKKMTNDGYATSDKEVINNLQNLLLNIEKTKTSQDFLHAKDVSKIVIKDLEERRRLGHANITGVPTGFKKLDSLTQGFQPGEMIVLAARPGMGKTAFALNIARYASHPKLGGKKVAFFTLEMPSTSLVTRLFGISSGVDLYRFKKPDLLTDSDMYKIRGAQNNDIDKLALLIDESAKTDLPTLLWKCRRLAKSFGLGMVIIDYLQLLSVNNEKSSRDRQNEVATISRNLKTLALELKIPVIALSQLSREVEKRVDKRPILSDLRESGTIEQDADIVLFLYRENYYNKQKTDTQEYGIAIPEPTTLLIAKHRNGTQADINLSFRLECGKFEDDSLFQYEDEDDKGEE
ncbi:replicative DNA helicase [Mycoplasma tauri]|uniref:replicative DNA helicase n=1 Tax=Mycoplasma tauri TaxID=547987 RepID=UPI001CC02E23|nr:replicative DNA helicase [Mycoplasma tauri]MBZ4226882.1 replicative DNA helicase [Mycoplasma tauri]